MDAIDALRGTIKELRADISRLNQEKEALFTQRREVGSQIAHHARNLKEFRQERDELTTQVQSSKSHRTKLNKDIRLKIAEVKKLQEQKAQFLKKAGVKSDPVRLKKQIEKLEERIETEALSFKKELEVMRQLKDLRKEYTSVQGVKDLVQKIQALSKEIDGLKTEANSHHKVIQTNATESQEKHLELIGKAKSIDELRKEEQELEAAIAEKKSKIKEVGAALDEKQLELSKLTGEEVSQHKERKKSNEQQMKKKLATKQAEVSEKLKTGKTLTTEDLLVLQGMDD